MAHHDQGLRPGSEEAVSAGCTCPIMDNHYGAGRADGTFVYSGDCELHLELFRQLGER